MFSKYGEKEMALLSEEKKYSVYIAFERKHFKDFLVLKKAKKKRKKTCFQGF